MADEMDYMEQAKELADSYRLLVHRRDMLRQQYEDSRSWFYTKDEIIYKLSQGAPSSFWNPITRSVKISSCSRLDCAVFGGVRGSWQSSSLWTAESTRRSLVWMGEF